MSRLVASLIAISALGARVPAQTVPAITAEDLKTRLYIFADDSMEGRSWASPGHAKATAYIERELRRIGLQPAGDAGTFFQSLGIVEKGVDEATTLSADGVTLVLWDDYAPLAGQGRPKPIGGARVVYGGIAFDSTKQIGREQVAGKLVLLRVEGGGQAVNFRNIGVSSRMEGAAAVALVGLERLSPTLRAQLRTTSLLQRSGTARDTALAPAVLLVSTAAASRLLGGDVESAEPGASGRTVSGRILVTERESPIRNVVAVLPGSDPARRGQYVAIGAHSDHVGVSRIAVDHDSLRAFNAAVQALVWQSQKEIPSMPGGGLSSAQRGAIRVNVDSLRAIRPARRDSIRNGADDDGSGSMAMLEIAEAMASAPPASRPKRSVLFVWHTAEEIGLVGSEYFTDHPTVPRDSIVAQLNMDMIGRGEREDVPYGGPTYLQLVGSRRLSSELGDLVESVNRARPQPFTLDYTYDKAGHPEQIYCRSDHYSYARFGIPVVFFTTGGHVDYHQVTDEPQYIQYPHYARVTQLVHDVALRLAELPARPKVDGPRPQPGGQCVQ